MTIQEFNNKVKDTISFTIIGSITALTMTLTAFLIQQLIAGLIIRFF